MEDNLLGCSRVEPVIKHHNWTCEVHNGILVAFQQGKEQMRLPLAPLIEGESTTVEEWNQTEPNHWVGCLDRGGTVHLAVDCGHICYWMETDIAQFQTLTYFPGAETNGRYWHTFLSDEHDRKWDIDIDQEVGISSAYHGFNPFGECEGFLTDPGDFPPYLPWNIPPRAVAIQTQACWVGLSIPGALPVGIVRPKMDGGRFSLNFDVLRPSCRGGMMPRVYIVTGLADPYDALDAHLTISEALGLTVKKNENHPLWWTNPEYCYWDEFHRSTVEDPESARNQTLLTQDRYLSWLNTVRDSIVIREMNITFEQGCYRCYGDYRPTEAMGGVEGFRRMIDELREDGVHSGFYIHPYLVNTNCEFFKKHPEAFCKPKDKSLKAMWSLEYTKDAPEWQLLDWTHPLAREHMEETIKFLYSDGPGCLNCDIVRSNNWYSPDPRLYDFHDPDWGIGDLMTYKVQRFIYETAKKIKPECMVSKVSVGDPYMQPWADMSLLCEEYNGYTDNWYERGRIATRAVSGLVFVTDPWFVTLTKGYEYYMGMLAWNIPATPAVRHAIHPYMTKYRELEDKDFRRRKAGFHAAMNAPFRVGDVCRVNILPDGEVEQWRKRTAGRLAGFYAALAIGKRTFVTYSDTEARVATSISRSVEFPLPPGAKVEMVEMVSHKGTTDDWKYEPILTVEGPGLRMHVDDCGMHALYYRVRYVLDTDG